MKRLIIILVFIFLCSLAGSIQAQVPSTNARKEQSGAGSPNGVVSCTPGPPWTSIYINTLDRSEWYCTASPSTWTQVTSGTPATTGASTALDNLASVAINTSLLPATAGAINLGSTSKAFQLAYIGSGATTRTALSSGATGQRALFLPDASGTLETQEYGAAHWQPIGSYPTNSAGANVVPKSDGTNLVASRISDDGTDIHVGATNNSLNLFGTDSWDLGDSNTNAFSFIAGSPATKRLQFGSDAEQIDINGTAHTITATAATAINLDSKGGVTTIGDVNGVGNGTTLEIDDANLRIFTDGSSTIQNNLLQPLVAGTGSVGSTQLPFSSFIVGNAANNSSQITGTFTGNRVATLPDATGTVALVGTNLGTVLSIPSANATLASATGTTYSSPGYGGTPLASTSEAQVGWVCPRAGTISTLYVITGSVAKVNTPATTITLRKNGADTAVTLALTQTTATVSSDLTHSFSVAAGDILTISFTTTGAAAVSTSIAGVSFLLN